MAGEYQQTNNPWGGLSDSVLRVADHAMIPADPANRDYQEYLAWIDEGNTPDPPPAPPEASP